MADPPGQPGLGPPVHLPESAAAVLAARGQRWIAVNPAPDVAGLRFCLDELLAMKAGTADERHGGRNSAMRSPRSFSGPSKVVKQLRCRRSGRKSKTPKMVNSTRSFPSAVSAGSFTRGDRQRHADSVLAGRHHDRRSAPAPSGMSLNERAISPSKPSLPKAKTVTGVSRQELALMHDGTTRSAKSGRGGLIRKR